MPFGPHPHRGFETVTFVLAGALVHRDSAGSESVIRERGVQWMTAGSGLVHDESVPDDFRRDGGRLEILQLWVNLPAHLKGSPPRYVGVPGDLIPTIEEDKGRIRLHLIAGTFDGVTGPVVSLTGVFMSVVDVGPGGQLQMSDLAGRDVFLYVVRGAIYIGGTGVGTFSLARLTAGEVLKIESDTGSTVILGHAASIDEPVVAHGPFVMNSMEEIRQAYADYHAGRLSQSAASIIGDESH
jgi:hypothetical protein